MQSLLIVEDDESTRELLRVVALRAKFAVDVAGDGDEAIAKLLAKKYDLVTLDLMLPRRNGFEVAAVIYALDPRPRLIVFSALARHFEDRFWEGVVVLQKPFAIPEMESILLGQQRPAEH